MWLFIWTSLNPLYLVMPSLIKIGEVVLEKMKMWKVCNNDNDNNLKQWTYFDKKTHLSLPHRWAKKFFFPPCGFVLTVFHYLSFFYFLYYGTQRSTKSGIKNLLDITNNVYNESYLFCLGALLYWYIRSFLQNYVIQSELDKERFPQSTTDTHLSGMLHN